MKPALSSIASASAAVRRGALGMDFDGGSENLAAQGRRALLIGQGLQEKFNCLTDIGKSLLDCLSLRFGTPSVPGTMHNNLPRLVRSPRSPCQSLTIILLARALQSDVRIFEATQTPARVWRASATDRVLLHWTIGSGFQKLSIPKTRSKNRQYQKQPANPQPQGLQLAAPQKPLHRYSF